ncbi:hypothetical protein BGX24_008376 [Mortierella sp. AD032]|nr:hypothetical protein BGX24_008376 [Mortierella sp. AD032]
MPTRAHQQPTADPTQQKESNLDLPAHTDLHENDNTTNNTYTPSSAAKEINLDSPATTPIDDPIYLAGSDKHFGFSSRQSRASSIFPWRKHKPAVCHQYAPHRPPLSKRSSLAGLKVIPVASADPVKQMDDEELDLL